MFETDKLQSIQINRVYLVEFMSNLFSPNETKLHFKHPCLVFQYIHKISRYTFKKKSAIPAKMSNISQYHNKSVIS